MPRWSWLTSACTALVLASGPVYGVELSEQGALELELLIQTTLSVDEAEQGEAQAISIDPHLERAWFALSGQPAERLSFFVQAGVDELGLAGDWTPSLELRDAWIEWSLGERLQLDAGLLRPPWAAHALLLEATRVGIAGHEALLPYPTGVAGRDVGLQARGRLFGQRLEYRLAGLAGVEAGQGHADTDYDGDGLPDAPVLNPDDLPRVTARLAWSFFEPLGGAGLDGYRIATQQLPADSQGPLLSQRRVLTVGVAVDHQQDALYVEERDYTGGVSSARRADYTALTADLLADLPLAGGKRSLAVLVAGFHYPLDEGHPASGQGILAEVGYRIGRFQPLASYELLDADLSSAHDRTSMRGGLAWWARGSAANLRLEAGAWRQGGGNELLFTSSLRAQLYF